MDNLKKALYTIKFGNYDGDLKEPLIVTKGWDYICFTDLDIKSDIFKIIKVDTQLNGHLAARYHYINSNLVLPEYDLTVMIGGQMQCRCNLDKFLEDRCNLNYDFNMLKHPTRTCIYQEGLRCMQLKKDNVDTIKKQMTLYRNNGMPKNIGLKAHGIIVSKNNPRIRKHQRLWWEQVKTYSHRDQLSFMYILWKYRLVKVFTMPWNVTKKEFKRYRYD